MAIKPTPPDAGLMEHVIYNHLVKKHTAEKIQWGTNRTIVVGDCEVYIWLYATNVMMEIWSDGPTHETVEIAHADPDFFAKLDEAIDTHSGIPYQVRDA